MKKYLEVIFHLVFWSIIIYLYYYYCVTKLGLSFTSNFGMFNIPHLVYVLFFTLLPPVTIFYLFYFIFIPIIVVQKKTVLFFIIAISSSVIIGYLFRLTVGGGTPLGRFVTVTLMAFLWGIVGGAFKGVSLWLDSINERRIIEKKHLESKNALLLLQAQINPHFLFNSLNNIDILIEENPKKGSEYLRKLSDILRYFIYETKEEETELSKEIYQIRNYIDLQKIRTSNPKYVSFNIIGELKDQKVVPMLFIPFIENAFKYSKNKTIENAIAIEFEIQHNFVKMVCKNYFESSQIDVIKNEGLGNETIKQRLNLLYPNKHKLIIEKTEQSFKVTLEISL